MPYIRTNHGRNTWTALKSHYEFESYTDNLVSAAQLVLSNTIYNGERPRFTMGTYYSLYNKVFQDLQDAGPSHELTNQQQITAFKRGFRDHEAIRCTIQAFSQLASLPTDEQTFPKWYNIMNGQLNTFLTLTQKNTSSRQNHPVRISN